MSHIWTQFFKNTFNYKKTYAFVSTTVQQLTSQKILRIVLRGVFGDR